VQNSAGEGVGHESGAHDHHHEHDDIQRHMDHHHQHEHDQHNGTHELISQADHHEDVTEIERDASTRAGGYTTPVPAQLTQGRSSVPGIAGSGASATLTGLHETDPGMTAHNNANGETDDFDLSASTQEHQQQQRRRENQGRGGDPDHHHEHQDSVAGQPMAEDIVSADDSSSIPPLPRNTRPGTTRSNGERLFVNGEPFSKRRCLCERVDLVSIKGETSWCRYAEELMGEEKHECFDWMVTLPPKGSPGEIRHGVNIRERWLQHLGLTEAMIEGVKDQRIRWTHFPAKCWDSAVKARQELRQQAQKRIEDLRAKATLAHNSADAQPDTAAGRAQRAAAYAEVKLLLAKIESIQEEADKPKRTLRRLTWFVDRDMDDSPEDYIMYRRRRDRGELVPKALAMPNVKWDDLKPKLQKAPAPASEVLSDLFTWTKNLVADALTDSDATEKKTNGEDTGDGSSGEAKEEDLEKAPVISSFQLFGVSGADLQKLEQSLTPEERASLDEKDRLAFVEHENELLRRVLMSMKPTFEMVMQKFADKLRRNEVSSDVGSGSRKGGQSKTLGDSIDQAGEVSYKHRGGSEDTLTRENPMNPSERRHSATLLEDGPPHQETGNEDLDSRSLDPTRGDEMDEDVNERPTKRARREEVEDIEEDVSNVDGQRAAGNDAIRAEAGSGMVVENGQHGGNEIGQVHGPGNDIVNSQVQDENMSKQEGDDVDVQAEETLE